MGGMHTQLMRATCYGDKSYACIAIFVTYNLKICYRTFAVGGNHLTRAIFVVEFYRQVDLPFVGRDYTIK